MNVLFVCHGNICRSVMAQCVLASLDGGKHFFIDSAATSTEEIGNTIYPPARRVLEMHGVPVLRHKARQVRSDEYDDWDLIIAMDDENLRNLRRLFGDDREDKVKLLLREGIADPWWTGDFDRAYDDIQKGCSALMEERVWEKR